MMNAMCTVEAYSVLPDLEAVLYIRSAPPDLRRCSFHGPMLGVGAPTLQFYRPSCPEWP